MKRTVLTKSKLMHRKGQISNPSYCKLKKKQFLGRQLTFGEHCILNGNQMPLRTFLHDAAQMEIKFMQKTHPNLLSFLYRKYPFFNTFVQQRPGDG